MQGSGRWRPMVHVALYNSVSGASFWPRLADELAAAGHEVRSHHALPSDEYRRARNLFGRLWVRWRMSGGFACRVLLTIWFTRRPAGQTVHLVTTNPFFLPPLVAWAVSLRNEQTVFVLFDLYPD